MPIEGIIFGGRRPQGVPLIYESFNWQHGVFIGASMRSEATAAAEFKGNERRKNKNKNKITFVIRRQTNHARSICYAVREERQFDSNFIFDYFERPFVGYNFGRYIQHWLDFEKDPNNKVKKSSKIFVFEKMMIVFFFFVFTFFSPRM